MRTTSGDTADTVLEDNLISSGTFNVAANSTAIVEGNWQNSGAVNLNGSAAGAAQIEIEAGKNWTLLDGGAITLNGFNDAIVSQGAGAELRNRGNTIQGAGTIGDANMTIENDLRLHHRRDGRGFLEYAHPRRHRLQSDDIFDLHQQCRVLSKRAPARRWISTAQ